MPIGASNPWMEFYRATPMGRALDLNSRNSYLSIALHPETAKNYNKVDPGSFVDAFNPLNNPMVTDPFGTMQATASLMSEFAKSAANIWK